MSEPLRILLIEDNLGDIDLVQLALAEAGVRFQLRIAMHGADAAVALSDAEPADLLLLDLNLPGIDSDRLIDLCRTEAKWNGVPIIILSSSEAPHDVARAQRLPLAKYIRKPADLDSFLSIGADIRDFAAQSTKRRNQDA